MSTEKEIVVKDLAMRELPQPRSKDEKKRFFDLFPFGLPKKYMDTDFELPDITTHMTIVKNPKKINFFP